MNYNIKVDIKKLKDEIKIIKNKEDMRERERAFPSRTQFATSHQKFLLTNF